MEETIKFKNYIDKQVYDKNVKHAFVNDTRPIVPYAIKNLFWYTVIILVNMQISYLVIHVLMKQDLNTFTNWDAAVKIVFGIWTGYKISDQYMKNYITNIFAEMVINREVKIELNNIYIIKDKNNKEKYVFLSEFIDKTESTDSQLVVTIPKNAKKVPLYVYNSKIESLMNKSKKKQREMGQTILKIYANHE